MPSHTPSPPPHFPFNELSRQDIAARCAAFVRRPPPAATAGLKRAAVAITLLATPASTGFLLTRRAETLRAHGGQWALPGGRCDAGETATEAARRELHEELGLALDEHQVLGLLDDYPTRSGYLITPVVLWAGPDPQIAPNPAEVASVHHIDLAQILHPEAVDFIDIPESDRQVVRVEIDGDKVHAPTAAMLYQFRELLVGRTTRVDELEQPLFAWR